MDKLRKSYIINIIIVILEIFSNLWMMSGVGSNPHAGAASSLSAARLGMFKYFTVDSNILMGIFAFCVALEQYQILKGKKESLSTISYILKLIGTVGVTLTMLVTVFFLAPTMGPAACFANSNLFLHVINPVLSIVVFVCFEKTSSIDFKHTFTALIPLILYAIYYVIITVIHAPGGVIAEGYDWYGFFVLGLKSGFIIVPIIVLITYCISFVLWKFNKKNA